MDNKNNNEHYAHSVKAKLIKYQTDFKIHKPYRYVHVLYKVSINKQKNHIEARCISPLFTNVNNQNRHEAFFINLVEAPYKIPVHT